MSDTPETDGFYELLEGKCLPLDARYYHMRIHARKIELELHEQCRLLGMSAERECDLLGKLERERAIADRLADALRALCETLLADKPRDITEFLNKAGDALSAWKEDRGE